MRGQDDPSDEFSAVEGSTATSKPALMMRISVVTSQFFAGTYVAPGIEFRSAIGNPKKQIRVAGMVDELEGSAADTAVDGFCGAKFHYHYSLGSACALPCFSYRDGLPGELSQLCSGADGEVGEQAFALDRTPTDQQHFPG